MADPNDITQAASPRARRTKAAAAQKPSQASIDDFLGGGPVPTQIPPATGPQMPEPGGWVTDAGGGEKYDNGVERWANGNGVRLPRCPDGRINNCALANGDDEVNCQMCNCLCPDRKKYGVKDTTIASAPQLSQKLDADPVLQARLDKPAVPAGTIAQMRVDDLDRSLSGKPQLPAAYGRIVKTTFAFDPDKVFEALNDKLAFDKPLHEMGYLELTAKLDEAARLHRDASRLHAHAKVTLGRFDADCEVMQGDMRAQAVAQLKSEKEAKGGKQITDGDVTARMATIFPDEYRRQESLRAESKATIGHLETMVKVWEMRRRELDTMVKECRNRA